MENSFKKLGSLFIVSLLSLIILLGTVSTYELDFVPTTQSGVQVAIDGAALIRKSSQSSTMSLNVTNLGTGVISLAAKLENESFLVQNGTFSNPVVSRGDRSTFNARIANVASFNGVNGSIRVPNSASFNSPTFSFEIGFSYSSKIPDNQMIIGKGASGGNSFYFFSYRSLGVFNDFVMYVDNTRYDQQLGDIFAPNYWYDVVFTVDGSTIDAYVNGILVSSWQRSIVFNGNTNDLLIGNCICGGYNFNGSMSIVRFYDRAMTSPEITQNYLYPSSPALSGLSMWLPLGKGTAGSFPDISGHLNDGASTDGVQVVTPILANVDYLITILATTSGGTTYSTSRVTLATSL